MKIVVLDGYVLNPGDLSWEGLSEYGEVITYDRTSHEDKDEIIARIGDADVIYTNKVPITADIIDACPNLKYISVTATGYNVVDTEYAAKKGIPVSNVPAYGTKAVAQYAIGMLLELCHHMTHHSDAVHQGRWQNSIDWCFWDYPLVELDGKTLGIIGFGNIGRQVGRIASALGMRVIAYSRSEHEEGRKIGEYVDLDTLLSESDVISLHCPLFPDTQGIINKDTIARMKDGVMILNNSRGPMIVEQDLADALNCGKVAAAAVDVVSTEPIQADNPLLGAKNCLITPHISWASTECRQRILDISVNNLKGYVSGTLVNVVNQ